MNTPTITITIAGKLSVDRESLEQLLRSVMTPTPTTTGIVNQPLQRTDESNFINEKQLLARLPISRRTLFSWRMRGKIPHVKIGRRILFHWPSVEAALLRCQRGG